MSPNEIKLAVRQVHLAYDSARCSHNDRLKELDARLAEIQKHCAHDKFTYHGDPAGGSDSFYKCDDCGKYF